MLKWKTTARVLLAAASFAVLAACDAAKPAGPAAVVKAYDDAAWPAAAVADTAALGFSAEGLAALDARMAKSVADQDVAGMVTMLVHKGEVAQFNAYGVQSGDPKTGAPMTKDSLFRIYSMTKPITGVALMQLYEQGKWTLDDPITKHAPELAGLKLVQLDADGKAVMDISDPAKPKPKLVDPKRSPTMRELMSHTAGFGYGLSGNDPVNTAFRDQAVLASANLDEMMTKIAGIPLLYEPGSKWSYSVAVDIQGYLVQKLSGQKFGDYLKANIFTPLGMSETAFYVSEAQKPRFADVYSWSKDKASLVMNPERPDRPGFTDPNRMESGGGGLVSTTHDYARFSQMMLNKGTLGGKQVLKPESVDLMVQNHIGDLGIYSDGTNPAGRPGQKFGLDFAIVTDPVAAQSQQGKGSYYWGGAAGTWFWIDPVNDLFFVGMIQRMGGDPKPDLMNFRGESGKLVYDALGVPLPPAPAAAGGAAPQ